MNGQHRGAHPTSCSGCRNEMTWGVIAKDQHHDSVEGQCLGYHGRWPDGCPHYAEAVPKPPRVQQ